MSVQEVTMYRVVCDWPDCEATAQNGEFYAWNSEGAAVEEALDSDWVSSLRSRHYCPEHPTEHESDVTDGEPPLMPPCLVVNDDGFATLRLGDRARNPS